MTGDEPGAADSPAARQLSPDGRWWWTGREWSSPLYERSGLSALVTFLSRFLGTLRVFPGAVVFGPSVHGISHVANTALNIDRPPSAIVHCERQVAVFFARLAPPWLNSGVVLVDPVALGTGTAVVQLPGWDRRRLVDTLSRAGFAVDVHRTAFSMGSNIGSVAELQRLRRPSG